MMKNILTVKDKVKVATDVFGNLCPLAYPIGHPKATKKIKKLMAQRGISYEEARDIRAKRGGF